MKFWWAVRTTKGREFYVRGGFAFAVGAKQEAESRLDPDEDLESWFRVGEVFGHK